MKDYEQEKSKVDMKFITLKANSLPTSDYPVKDKSINEARYKVIYMGDKGNPKSLVSHNVTYNQLLHLLSTVGREDIVSVTFYTANNETYCCNANNLEKTLLKLERLIYPKNAVLKQLKKLRNFYYSTLDKMSLDELLALKISTDGKVSFEILPKYDAQINLTNASILPMHSIQDNDFTFISSKDLQESYQPLKDFTNNGYKSIKGYNVVFDNKVGDVYIFNEVNPTKSRRETELAKILSWGYSLSKKDLSDIERVFQNKQE